MTENQEKFTKETVLSIKKHTEKLLSFSISRPESYRFSAGQFSRLGFSDGNGFIWRAFSVASAEYADQLDYYAVLIQNGEMSQKIKAMKEGQTILLDKKATGFLLPERFVGGKYLIMLSTGSGVAPFFSQLQNDTLWQQFEKIILVHSVSFAKELISKNFIVQLKEHPLVESYFDRFCFIPIITRESASNSLEKRIPDFIREGILEKNLDFDLNIEDVRFLICGNPAMVQDTFKELLKKGFQMHRNRLPGHIIMENGF